MRDKCILKIEVPQSLMSTGGSERTVGWAGALFQMSNKSMMQQMKQVPSGIVCCSASNGSPAQLYGLSAWSWVQEANDIPINDLDDFLQIVSNLPTDSFVRLKLMGYSRKVKVVTIRTNSHYFGSWQLLKDVNSPSVSQPIIRYY